jgi:hypothetical protein
LKTDSFIEALFSGCHLIGRIKLNSQEIIKSFTSTAQA